MTSARERLEKLLRALEGAEQALIVPHNDPDPDAIAGAAALKYLLESEINLAVRIAYQGIIGRAENRALAHYLGVQLECVDDLDLKGDPAVILLDTQPGTGNNPLPPDKVPAVVIDHHPRREMTAKAGFAEIRPRVGACSTILTGYLRTAGIQPPQELATALFYGIHSDTRGLSRESSTEDVEAYFYLQPLIDVGALGKIMNAQVPQVYFQMLVHTLNAVRIYPQGVIFAYLGSTDYPDMAAEMADLLLRLEDSRWIVCMGTFEGVMVLSVRTQDAGGDAEKLACAIVQQDGTAGGHDMMAGGQIPLQKTQPDAIAETIRKRVLAHFSIPLDEPGKALILPH